MSRCRNPKCGKTLIGREKVLCTSCKEEAQEGGKKLFGIGVLALFLK